MTPVQQAFLIYVLKEAVKTVNNKKDAELRQIIREGKRKRHTLFDRILKQSKSQKPDEGT